MEKSPFLPLPEGMVIDQVEPTEAGLRVRVRSTRPTAPCPGCGNLSDHVHSQYQRTVKDVPCAGGSVVLRLCVRKFFCRVPTCQRKVFAERLPDLVQPWARVSNRLLSEVKALGLSASAEVNERLAPRLGMKIKAPTLLRYLRTIPPPVDACVRVLGIDDFGATRTSRMCSRKNSRKEALTWGSAPKCPTRLNQVRLGQCSRARKSGNSLVRGDYDCQHQAVRS